MHGFNQGILELKSLCNINNGDIIFLQEHWLNLDSLRHFDYFKNDYYIYGSSSMDAIIKHGILSGRPHGGLCTLIRKSFGMKFNKIQCIACTERYIIVALDKLLLINIYLPSCTRLTDLDSLCSIFNDITCAVEGLDVFYTIAGGDLNSNVLQTSQFSKC